MKLEKKKQFSDVISVIFFDKKNASAKQKNSKHSQIKVLLIFNAKWVDDKREGLLSFVT